MLDIIGGLIHLYKSLASLEEIRRPTDILFYTGRWSNWARSNWDKIDLIGRWTYAIDIQAAFTAEPPTIYLEKSERNSSRAFVYRFPFREIPIAQDLVPFVD